MRIVTFGEVMLRLAPSGFYRLRQAIPEVRGSGAGTTVPFVLADRRTIQINPEAVYQADVQQFADLIERDPEQAITLYRGDFLADFYLPDSETFEEWANGRLAQSQTPTPGLNQATQ